MYIVTFITKRSSREIIPQLQYPQYVTKSDLEKGSVIEIIDGNKKSPAFVYNIEPISAYKQQIRSGDMDPKKLRLSKTGEYKDGAIIGQYDPEEFKKYLDDNDLVKKSDDKFIRSFFPKKKDKIKKAPVKKKKKSAPASFSDMKIDTYFGNKPAHHSRMHELVDTTRNYFGDKAVHGQGSFSYYLGFFKKIPVSDIQQMFEESKRSGKPLLGQKKLFWWKIGNYIKGK